MSASNRDVLTSQTQELIHAIYGTTSSIVRLAEDMPSCAGLDDESLRDELLKWQEELQGLAAAQVIVAGRLMSKG